MIYNYLDKKFELIKGKLSQLTILKEEKNLRGYLMILELD